jgi:hypothetical protein
MGGKNFNNLSYYENLPYRKFLELLEIYNEVVEDDNRQIEEANERSRQQS